LLVGGMSNKEIWCLSSCRWNRLRPGNTQGEDTLQLGPPFELWPAFLRQFEITIWGERRIPFKGVIDKLLVLSSSNGKGHHWCNW
jgi:hypothetical protein